MKRFLCFVLMLCLVPFALNAKDGKKDNQSDEVLTATKDASDKDEAKNKKEVKAAKPSDYFEFKVNLKTKAEIALVDEDDTDGVDVNIAKNTPEFTTSANVFAKLINTKYANLIFGPTAFTEIVGKMDHRGMMNSNSNAKDILFFEKGNFFNYAGVKIGTKFGKGFFADSKFTMTVPFMADFIVNDTNDAADEAGVSVTDEFNYYTHFVLGTNLIADLEIKSKPLHFGFDVKNTFRIGGDVCSLSNKDAYKSLFFTSKNEVDFYIKPFNFINNNVDVEFKFYFRNYADFTGDNLELKKRAYFGITWDGLKYFALRYKPIIYNDESDYQFADVTVYTSVDAFKAYYTYYNFSTEIALIFGNKYFNVEVAYEPSYYTIDDGNWNADSVREHKVSCAVEIKF